MITTFLIAIHSQINDTYDDDILSIIVIGSSRDQETMVIIGVISYFRFPNFLFPNFLFLYLVTPLIIMNSW